MGHSESGVKISVETLGMSIQTRNEVEQYPMETGTVLIGTEEGLSYALLSALENPETRQKATAEVASALIMSEVVNWKPVRFPRLHKALGRIVITDDGVHKLLYQK